MATDEELLIEAARRERRNRRSGRNLILALAAAAVCAAIGWVLVFRVRAFLKAIPFLPLGTVTSWLLVVGIVAFGLAGLIVAGAFLMANPRKRWGDPVAGACPACGNWTLRQDTVTPAASPGNAPKGVVTLCDTKGCGYASATVTTASRVKLRRPRENALPYAGTPSYDGDAARQDISPVTGRRSSRCSLIVRRLQGLLSSKPGDAVRGALRNLAQPILRAPFQ